MHDNYFEMAQDICYQEQEQAYCYFLLDLKYWINEMSLNKILEDLENAFKNEHLD